jgi:prepilin-type N-terminal cleavage/methylation domain-containing protein
MYRNEKGFNLVELMITVVVFLLAIVAGAQIFAGLLTQFKQQSKIAENNIEGAVGLDILRRDLSHAGFGLPWDLNGATYLEAGIDVTPWVDRDLNDGPPNNPGRGTDPAGASNPPAPVRSLHNLATTMNRSDVLAIKAVNVAMNETAQKSTYIWKTTRSTSASLPNAIKIWGPSSDDLLGTDYITVMNPGKGAKQNVLMNTGSAGVPPYRFYTTRGEGSCTFNSNAAAVSTPCMYLDPVDGKNHGFEPDDGDTDNYTVYGLTPAGTVPRMPFNRADYYLRMPADIPSRCAPGTGILYKATVNHSDGLHTELPLLDCVAFMQVDYWLDYTGPGGVGPPDGIVDWSQPEGVCGAAPQSSPTSDISCLTAAQIRAEVKEVRVYILAHEGQLDPRFDFSQGGAVKSISVTEVLRDPLAGDHSRTLTFPPAPADLSTIVGSSYKNYRWKLYTLVVQLRQ